MLLARAQPEIQTLRQDLRLAFTIAADSGQHYEWMKRHAARRALQDQMQKGKMLRCANGQDTGWLVCLVEFPMNPELARQIKDPMENCDTPPGPVCQVFDTPGHK
jgi:hypothetical protein